MVTEAHGLLSVGLRLLNDDDECESTQSHAHDRGDPSRSRPSAHRRERRRTAAAALGGIAGTLPQLPEAVGPVAGGLALAQPGGCLRLGAGNVLGCLP